MRFDPFGRSQLTNVHRRFRLGQYEQPLAEAPEVITPEMIAGALPNRLSEVPVRIILARHRLRYRMFAIDGMVSTDTSWLTSSQRTAENFRQVHLFEGWTEDDLKSLISVANDPTEAELEDLALIDGFFRGSVVYREGCMQKNPSFSPVTGGTNQGPTSLRHMCSGKQDPDTEHTQESRDFAASYAKNPFFCNPAQAIPVPKTMRYLVQTSPYGGRIKALPDFFEIDADLSWEEVKPVVLRAVAVLEALVDYPFPPPIDIRPQYWYVSLKGDLNKFIRQDIIITKPLARLWITVSTVNKYNALAAWIVHDLEKKARDDKRKKIIEAIALGATFAVITLGLGYALAPLIAPLVSAGIPVTASSVASTVMSGVQQALSAQQKKQAAEDMDKVGKMFEADAPAFAKEAYAARDTFNYLGEAMSELTEEQKAAIQEVQLTPEYSAAEVGEQYDIEPSSWPLQKQLLIGGGIAAGVGVLAWVGISLLGS